MRLFLYYAFCSVKNQIKRSLKSWMIIFVIFGAIAAIIGFVIAIIPSDSAGNDIEYDTEYRYDSEYGSETEYLDDTEYGIDVELIVEDSDEEYDINENTLTIMGVDVTGIQIFNLVVSLVILVLLFIMIQNAEKGAAIFLPADAALLFPSPLKPQSVLLFRLMNDIALSLFGSVYLIIQIPNIMSDMNLPSAAVFMTLGAWFLLLIFGKLLQVFLYVFSSVHEKFKPWIARLSWILVFAAAGGLFLYMGITGQNIVAATIGYFGAPVSNYIPVWGWLKGMCMFAAEGRISAAFLCLTLMLVLSVAAARGIWQMKADFYEDAMARTEEAAREQQKSAPDEVASDVKRSEKRTAKLTKRTFHRGSGANVFFHKTLYNRFRYARFGILTKTSGTYFLVTVLVCVVERFLEIYMLFPVIVVLAVLVFYRTLGAPLSEEMRMHFFRLVPESSFRKLFWCVTGGSVNTCLDLVPAMILAVVLLSESPMGALEGLLWLMLLDFFAVSVSALIDLTTPKNSLSILKQMVQLLFLFFGLLPDLLLYILGMTFLTPIGGALLAAAFNLAVGAAALGITGAFL